MNIFDIVNMRSEYEEIIENFKLPEDRYGSSIFDMEYFITDGIASNGLRTGCDRAVEICYTVIQYYNNLKEEIQQQKVL